MTSAPWGFIALGVLSVLFLLPFAWLLMMRYLVLPLRARGTGMPADPEFLQTDISQMPPHVARQFARAARQLLSCGFQVGAHVRGVEHVPGSDAHVSVWLHPADGASAHVIDVKCEIPGSARCDSYVVTFCTEFADDAAVVTSTSPQISCFCPDPKCDTVRWPGMDDLPVVYRLHAARVERARQGRATFLPARDQVVAYLRATNTRTLWRQVAAGYFWFDAPSGAFRRTLRGSFLMYWRLLWPWKQLRCSRLDRKLRRAIAEVGMGRPEDYPMRPTSELAADVGLDYEQLSTTMS
jgi:hypothetical protein